MGASVEKLQYLEKLISGAPYSGDGKVGVSSRVPLLEPPTLPSPKYGAAELTSLNKWDSLTGTPTSTGRLNVRLRKGAKSAPLRRPVPLGLSVGVEV